MIKYHFQCRRVVQMPLISSLFPSFLYFQSYLLLHFIIIINFQNLLENIYLSYSNFILINFILVVLIVLSNLNFFHFFRFLSQIHFIQNLELIKNEKPAFKCFIININLQESLIQEHIFLVSFCNLFVSKFDYFSINRSENFHLPDNSFHFNFILQQSFRFYKNNFDLFLNSQYQD